MEYFSSYRFIPKLETKNYYLGSFDVFLEKAKETMKKYVQTLEAIEYYGPDDLLSLLPISLRASIVSKETGDYVGFISAIEVDNQNSIASIHFEADKKLLSEDVEEIIDTYEEFLSNSLNIKKRKDLVVLNRNAVIYEEGDFKEEIKVLVDPHLELRYISARRKNV